MGDLSSKQAKREWLSIYIWLLDQGVKLPKDLSDVDLPKILVEYIEDLRHKKSK